MAARIANKICRLVSTGIFQASIASVSQRQLQRILTAGLKTQPQAAVARANRRSFHDLPEIKTVQTIKSYNVTRQRYLAIDKSCQNKENHSDRQIKIKLHPNTFHRRYTFAKYTKKTTPYPSFSEAQDEKRISSRHYPIIPGSKTPRIKCNIHGRKFHTDCKRCVTLRFGRSDDEERKRIQEEIQSEPHAIRPHNCVRRWVVEEMALAKRILPPHEYQPAKKFEFKPIPEEDRDEVTYLADTIEQEAEEAALQTELDVNEKNREAIKNMILAKDRVKVLGQPNCPKNECDSGPSQKKKCPKKIKKQICPKDLLDRKPYKKYRDAQKKAKKGKGKKECKSKEKQADSMALTEEQMGNMMIEAEGGKSSVPRTEVAHDKV